VTKECYEKLAHRLRINGAEIVTADEFFGWDKGARDELLDKDILRQTENVKGVKCIECEEGCFIEPERRTDPETKKIVGVYMCEMGRIEIELDRLRCWRINKEKLIELGYYQETEDNRGKRGKKKTKKQAKKKKNFEHWPSPGDACLIIENERIKFYYNGKIEDLKLKKDSNADRLIKLLQAPVSGKIVKHVLCSPGTRPSDLKDQTNEQLNKKIVAVGFVMPMNNIEFIRYVDTRNEYECVLEIHQSRDDFMRSQLEQPLVDGRGFKDLDTAEDQY